MPRLSLIRDRRSAVSILFAAAAIPLIAVVGVAIDFGFWNQARSQLQVASDAAAVNAVRIASTLYVDRDTQWNAKGVATGNAWFLAQLGRLTLAQPSAGAPTITVTRNNLTFTANVTYTATMNTFFGGLFGVRIFGLAGASSATITTTAYNEILLMLDNSSSMEIGASPTDQNRIEMLVPCDPSGPGSGQGYSGNYTCAGYNASPGNTCPITSTSPFPLAGTQYQPGPTGPACTNLPKSPPAQAPCAFACHWDAGGNDYYGAVRRWSAAHPDYAIQLRFDLVQSATAAVLTTLAQYEIPGLNNISVGVDTFNNNLTPVYPTDGSEATIDVTDAPAAVQGIPANVSGNNPNTNFPAAMTTLASKVSPSGDGSAPNSPRKSLIIITDGFADYGNRYLGPFSVASCNLLKSAPYNFVIYVIYTPYYSLMNGWYVSNAQKYVEGASPTPVQAGLQACASDPVNDYYEASDLQHIQAALGLILQAAIKTSVRFLM